MRLWSEWDRIGGLLRRGTRGLPVYVRNSQVALCKPGGEHSPEAEPCQTFMLYFWSPELCENNFLLLKHPVYSVLLGRPTPTKTPGTEGSKGESVDDVVGREMTLGRAADQSRNCRFCSQLPCTLVARV